MYLGILTLLRFVLKRESGSVSTSDLPVMFLINGSKGGGKKDGGPGTD